MKKIFTALFAVAVLASLSACDHRMYANEGVSSSGTTMSSGTAMESHAERK